MRDGEPLRVPLQDASSGRRNASIKLEGKSIQEVASYCHVQASKVWTNNVATTSDIMQQR